MRLSRHSYATLRSIQGPLIFVEKVLETRMGEVGSIVFPDGHETEGEVLRIERDTVLIQVVGDNLDADISLADRAGHIADSLLLGQSETSSQAHTTSHEEATI